MAAFCIGLLFQVPKIKRNQAASHVIGSIGVIVWSKYVLEEHDMKTNSDATVDFAAYIPWLRRSPHAVAILKGDSTHPDLTGIMRFFQTEYGVLAETSLSGLPSPADLCASPAFGFHIHEGRQCGRPMPARNITSEPFAAAMGHYNSKNCDHSHHAGDLPPLLGCSGRAYQMFLTNRFRLNEVIGRTVIVHAMPDDFTTQPSGASGERIACGIITVA